MLNTNKFISGTNPIYVQAYIYVKQVVNMNTVIVVHKKSCKNIKKLR